eukprot:TRINITY_DN62168_c0_g1_i1.p1 TRINITY_DN62168_c0_g1~~TRINITY_DN62168_c0_g1_i1.p1  ORF type:complete len:1075 (+),score=225.88 TRINITY_DN62168_c0_g1_i1:156-3227(+)
MDAMFEGKHEPEQIEELKRVTFEKVYANMGSEIPPAELKRAIVIKTPKFHPVSVVLLNIFTLGLFTIFRPKDDDTILVLTENGRVYLLKVERPNVFGADLQVAFLTFFRLILIVLLIVTAPTIIWMMFGEAAVGDVGTKFSQENLWEKEMDLDARLLRKAKKSTALLCSVVAVIGAFAGCWLYTNWPADYATRSRQSFKADGISSVQYTITGAAYARKLTMRLFFGIYPGQAVLDSAGLAAGCSAGPVPKTDLCDPTAASLGSGGNSSKTSQTQTAQSTTFSPMFVTFLTVVLFVVTTLDAGFTWWERVVALSHLATVREFCVQAPIDETGPDMCTIKSCSKWAESINYDDDFCTAVRWYDDPKDEKVMAMCLQYGHTEGSCCGGCMLSAKGLFGDGWLEVLQTILEVVGDIGTLLFSFVAAKYALNVSASSENVEIICQKAPDCFGLCPPPVSSKFELVEPLALEFLSSMFGEAWEDLEDQQVVADPSANLAGEEKDRGVQAFQEITNPGLTWEEYLQEGSVVKMDLENFLMTVNVPRHPLGLQDKEQVVAGWSEMERMRFHDLGPSVLYGLIVLVVVMIAAPAQKVKVGGHTYVGAMKVIEGIMAGAVVTTLHVLWRYFVEFRSYMHAVVVTDMRLFYMRQQPRIPFTTMFGSDLRVDAFRHDRNVFYGRCTNTTQPFLYRMMGFRYMPGVTYMQCKFGVLKLMRENGNAMDVFHVVSQLARKDASHIDEESLKKAGCTQAILDECKETVRRGLLKKLGGDGQELKGVWDIAIDKDRDCVEKSPDIYMCHEEEQMLFHWSGQEAGTLASGYNSNTDVIVTSDRVFLWQRPIYKSFDCKTCLCYGTCWCGCLQRCLEASMLPNTMSFISHGALLSFSSESQIDPPLWTNPVHPPIVFPCCDECCATCTRCMTCTGFAPQLEKCSCLPKRPNPRSQLYLMWRSKFNGQQPDLTCVVRPYQDRQTLEDEDKDEGLGNKVMDLMEQGGLFTREPGQEEMTSELQKLNEVAILRKLMATVQADLGK